MRLSLIFRKFCRSSSNAEYSTTLLSGGLQANHLLICGILACSKLGWRCTTSPILTKDKVAYEAVMKKIEEVLACTDVDHYKNLRYAMKDKKRVHVAGSFVLVFSYDKSRNFVSFLDYDHHDNIYG